MSTATYLDDDEANATADGQLYSHLIGEVLEGGLDDDGLSSLYELKASSRKSKSDSNKSRLQVEVFFIISSQSAFITLLENEIMKEQYKIFRI